MASQLEVNYSTTLYKMVLWCFVSIAVNPLGLQEITDDARRHFYYFVSSCGIVWHDYHLLNSDSINGYPSRLECDGLL